MVVERSKALVYLMPSVLELKVEGSNPGHPEKLFIYFSECRDKNELIRDIIHSIFGGRCLS